MLIYVAMYCITIILYILSFLEFDILLKAMQVPCLGQPDQSPHFPTPVVEFFENKNEEKSQNGGQNIKMG